MSILFHNWCKLPLPPSPANALNRRAPTMSQILINDYLRQLDVIKKASGSQRESIVREAFKDLLKAWGRQHDLVFLAAGLLGGQGRR